ncbi:MAG: outer membrane protein assembly factor BamB family protein, partial [Planctomycetota bacterium]
MAECRNKTNSHTYRAIARAFSIALALWAVSIAPVRAEDWPTYMHDNARSGVSSESLSIDDLEQGWVYVSPAPPRRAWSNGPRWDAWSSTTQVPMRDFDTAFFVTVVGDNVYFGSSVTNSVHCLNASNGSQKWFFRTDGPVRYPPSYDNSKLYFGSDDGYAYCISADDGSMVWKYSPTGKKRVLCNNGSLITMWPIRTGTAVLDGKVYFAASLVPWENSFLCSLNAATGLDRGAGLFTVSLSRVTPAGAILASQSKLYLTQGRLYPRAYNRTNGSGAGTFSGSGGGAYALLTSDGPATGFVYGQGRNDDKSGYELSSFSDRLANHPNGKYMVVAGGYAYVVTESFDLDTTKGYRRNAVTRLSAISRGTGSALWNVTCGKPYYSLILAGDVLFAGSTGEVVAHST